MLMPYMSDNLAQILRMWVAKTILTGEFSFPTPLNATSQQVVLTGQSRPSALFQWQLHPQAPLIDRPSEKTYLQSLRDVTEPPQKEEDPATPMDTHIETDQQLNQSKVTLSRPEKKKKHSRWKRSNEKKQSTIRTFLVTQPKIYDFQFFKPQKKITVADPDIWGHVMEPINPQKIFRLLLQNPNGIQPHFSYSDFLFSLHMSENIGIGALSLPETNLNWLPHHIASTEKCFKKTWEHRCLQYSQGEEEYDSTYKPGGTLTSVMGSWSTRVVEKGVDPYGLGRWSYLTLRGRGNKKIYLVAVYRVCNKKDSGPKTAYKQQFRSLSKAFRSQKIVTTLDPHRQCILDLQAWLKTLVHQNHAIILNLDSNEDISDKAGSFHPLSYIEGKHPISKTHDGSLATLITTCGLVDPLAIQHTSRPFPPTYNRGQSRLDYMLVTSGILSSVI
jgi:hypothetical protein